MNELSENKIKRIALGFLKSHYRYRPRLGETEASADMRGLGGIIADGYLQFKREDGTKFTATFEATSYETKQEVKYKIQHNLLSWDSSAIAIIGTAAFFINAYFEETYTIRNYGVWLTFAFLVGSFVSLFFFFRLLLARWKRYRYIYAIEQFKRYHADEQWIALGEDVFLGPDDPYYLELKKQCIRHGFGLILIDLDFKTHLQITPSREDNFQQSRKKISFTDLEEFTKRMDGQYQKWIQKINFIRNGSGAGNTESLLRFQKRYSYQMVLSLIAFLFICGVFNKELKDRHIVYVDERNYVEEQLVVKNKNKNEKEPISYLLDSASVRPYVDGIKAYKSLEETPMLVPKPSKKKGKKRKKIEETLPPPEKEDEEPSPEIIVSTNNPNEWLHYDCERFFNFSTAKYLVQAGEFSSLESTKKIMQAFREAGLEPSSVWLGCFFPENENYIVFLGPILSAKTEARKEALYYSNLLGYDSTNTKIKIRTIPSK